MSGPRLAVLLSLVALFVVGVFVVNKVLRPQATGDNSAAGSPGTIHGTVTTLLPSGKVIVVKKENGEEVLVSLTDASLITDEIGEPLFYSDVSAGMPISAAGIRGQENNVLIPSLVTVQLVRTYGGLLVAAAPSLRYEYFSLHYSQKLWNSTTMAGELVYRANKNCRLIAGAAIATPDKNWVEQKIERKIGGNIFIDSVFLDGGRSMRRTLVLDNAGYKYGLTKSNFGQYAFQVFYDAPLSSPELITCNQAVNDVLETFALRNASENILLVEPDIPIHVTRGELLTVEGMAKTSDSAVEIQIVDETKRVLWRGTALTNAKDRRSFGRFTLDVGPLNVGVHAAQIRVFRYGAISGTPTDVVSLPLTIE